MSLIEEALRKQQEEFGDGAKKQGGAAPDRPASPSPAAPASPERASGELGRTAERAPAAPEPAPEPAPAPPAAGKSHSRILTPILAAVALILLLGVAAFWLLQSGLRGLLSRTTTPVSPPAATTRTPVRPSTTTARVTAPSTTTALPTAAIAPVAPTTPAVAVAAAAPPPSVAPNASPAPRPTATPGTGAGATPTTTAAPPPEESPEPEREPVEWPPLSLSGLVGSTARINGKLIAPGDTVDGVRVLAIGREGVTLFYEGETKVLKMGGRLE